MKEIIILIILPLLSLVFSQECIIGKNCPNKQGICVGTSCNCLDGYITVLDSKLSQTEQIYCNYPQKHHLTALILELFLPSIGHFYVGKYWFGIIKLIFGETFVLSNYYVYKELKIPSYIQALWETILNNPYEGDIFSATVGPDFFYIARLLFNISFYPFWIFYIVDIYMYYSKTYYDGNGVPLF